MYGAAHSVRIRPGFVPHDAPAGAAHDKGRPRARGRRRAGRPHDRDSDTRVARYESMSIDFILVVLIMLEHENRMVFICVTVSVYAVSGSEYRFPRGSPFANGLVSVQSPPRRIR